MIRSISLCIFAMFCGVSCHVTKIGRDTQQYFQTKPTKTITYQIRDHDGVIGYADKYEWETTRGDQLHYYIICDAYGNLAGHVRNNGETIKYSAEGNETLGNYTLNRAVERIFSSPYTLQTVEANLDEQYMAWTEVQKPSQPKIILSSSNRLPIASPKRETIHLAKNTEDREAKASEQEPTSPLPRISEEEKTSSKTGAEETSKIDQPKFSKAEESKPKQKQTEDWPEETEAWPDK